MLTPFSNRPASSNWRAFTIVELLVVIVIMTLLVSMLLPTLRQAREVSKRLTCASVMRGLGVITIAYSNDYKGWYPSTYSDYDTSAYGASTYPVTSMNALWYYGTGDINAFFCPTVQQRSSIPFGSFSKAVQIASTNQNYLPQWGYQKFVATIDPADISGSYGTPRYDTANAVARDPNWPIATASQFPCYQNNVQVETASIGRVHYGNRGQTWSSTSNGLLGPVINPHMPQPPSLIAFWGDPWTANGVGQGIASHLQINFISNGGPYPLGYSGKNEVMADGHVTWYSADKGNLYYTFNGQAGAVLVQDDQ